MPWSGDSLLSSIVGPRRSVMGSCREPRRQARRLPCTGTASPGYSKLIPAPPKARWAMKAVMPNVSLDILETRKRNGAAQYDEMWEGVLHMAPVPTRNHQDLEGSLE